MAIENGVLKPSGAIQIRGGTYEALEAENPILARRELCVEFDGGAQYLKVGDGETHYLDLPYIGENSSGGVDPSDDDDCMYVMQNGGWTDATNVLQVPNEEDCVYVMKNGAWTAARLVTQPWEWSPDIDNDNDIVLTLDEDMNVYQLTGRNVVVNS